jgi:hypothetical protein
MNTQNFGRKTRREEPHERPERRWNNNIKMDIKK